MTTAEKINQIVEATSNLTEVQKIVLSGQISITCIQVYYDGLREGNKSKDIDDCPEWIEYSTKQSTHS